MSTIFPYNFDQRENVAKFFGLSLSTIIVGLLLGGIIDSCIRKLQKDGEWKDRKYGKAVNYFLLQSSINIILLIALTRSTALFLPWFQLSVSGALFAVVLFIAQRNLADNALRITNF